MEKNKINSKNIILTAVIGLVLLSASFYGGMTYAKSQVAFKGPSDFGLGQQFGQKDRSGVPGQMGKNRMNFISGEILSMDSNSITLKLPDGGSKIILLSDSTEIAKSQTGAITDLKVGDNLIVDGTTNTDGSVTSKTIEIKSLPLTAPPENNDNPKENI